MEEDGVKLNLTVIDTPGFGDSINNSSGFGEILAYIERQYDGTSPPHHQLIPTPQTSWQRNAASNATPNS